jgi:hypothetical protein
LGQVGSPKASPSPFGQPSTGAAHRQTPLVPGGTATGAFTVGFSTGALPHPASFVTTLDAPAPPDPATAAKLVAEAQQVVARSSALPSKNAIRVTSQDGMIVLRGEVADQRERRLAEGLVRLTPGVHDVRNELVVRQPAATELPLPPP